MKVRDYLLDKIATVASLLVEEDDESVPEPIYGIGDKVRLVNDSKGKIYVIYSVTYYYGGRKDYTLWDGDDYTSCQEWQFEYIPTSKIGFINPEIVQPTHRG